MNSFRRIFKYVWPQKPRLIVVVLSAIIVAACMSLSFVTVIPLLKSMMSSEGIYGWLARIVIDERYDISFSIPGNMDQGDSQYQLIVTGIGYDSPVQSSGLQQYDVIVGVNDVLVNEEDIGLSRNNLLREIATAPPNSEITLLVYNLAAEDSEPNELAFNANWKPFTFYTKPLEKTMDLFPREITNESKMKSVVILILGVCIITIVRCTAKVFQEYMSQKVVQVGINRLRRDAFVHAINMPIGYFATERPSDTVSRIFRDSDVMAKAIKVILGKALREPLIALFSICTAMYINWQLTLIFLVSGPFILGLVVLIGRKMKKATKKSLVAGSRMLAKLQETMSALRVIKVYNRQGYENKNFEDINLRFLKQLLKISKLDSITMPFLEVLGMMVGSAAIVVGAFWITSGRMASPESFFGLLLLLGVAAESSRKTSDVWNKIQEANAAAERVFEVMDSPVEYESSDAIELPLLKKEIEFRNIVFTYPNSEKPVLNGINLKIKAGHNVALVGPNGSGKTTLANLLPRFYNPDSGTILIDGIDISRATLFSLRSQIAMVTQNVVTFNDTIEANIAYGKPGASREEIISAAKRSFAHEFIEPLPKRYDTIIGEDGAGLSGGQLQRIVIARAILKNPAILIFDEATSQVDAESESKIHTAIEEIMRDRTSIIIAHRFSTVVSADVVVVMDQGRIVDYGRHEQLIRNCRLYQGLYQTQLVKA